MAIAQDIRTAVQLTAEARAAAQVASTRYALEAYLPNVDNYALTFNFDVNQVDINEAASYRSFNTEAEYGKTGGSASRSGKLPPISLKYHVDELEQLTLYGQDDAIGDTLERYARRVGSAIAARVELARGQGIETGKVELNERDLKFTIDFGRSASHTVTAGTVWSNVAATPITDLDTWAAVYRATNGAGPGATLLSGRILAVLQKNADLIKLAVGRGSDLPSRISVDDVRSVLSSYGYGDVRVFDEVINGARVISDDKVIFLPTSNISLDGGALGTTDWGIPAESIRPEYGIPASDRPGIFAGAFTHEDPEGTNVLGSAIVLPVIKNANATFAADVL